MQEFNITGKTTITAEIKAQVDDSPIVVPPKEGVADENIQPLVEVTSDTIDLLNNTNQIINNFDNNLNHTTDVFRAMNEVVTKTTQNLANYGTNKTNSSLLALPPPEGTDGQTILIPQQETQLDEIDNQNIIDQQKQDVETPITKTIPTPEETQTMQPLVDSVDTTTESMKSNNIMLKEFGEFLPVLLKNFQSMNDAVARTNQNLPAIGHVVTSEEKKKKQLDEYNRQNFMQLVTTGSNTVQSVANGNVAGAVIGGVNQVANTSNSLAKVADMNDMTTLAKGLVAAGAVTAVAGVVLKAGDTLANKYLDEMPTIFGTGKAFGSTSDIDAMISYQKINEKNVGTGLNIEDFNSIAQSLRKYGVANGMADKESLVGDIAQTTSRWAYATGGSAEEYANLAGLMYRYGGSKNVSEDFNKIVTSGYASGLEDTQIPEFLSSIQKVMEEGIAKGFSRSATEVADTLLMFSKMSGNNAFWQGEQGAKVLNQANSGIASATGMSKTEDIIVFRAFQEAYKDKDIKNNELKDTYVENGGYVNTMQLIEQGINGDNFNAIMESLESAYGKDNKEAQIEALRKMTGLNYTGAARLLNLDRNASDETIQKIIESPENTNKETQYMQATNDIKEAVVAIGESAADIKVAATEHIAKDLNKITGWLGTEYADKAKQKEYDNLIENLTPAQQKWLGYNPNYFLGKSEDEALADLKTLSEWSGTGELSIDTTNNGKITGYNPLNGQKNLFSTKQLGSKGGKKEGNYDMELFFRENFATDIEKLAQGNSENVDNFINYILTDKDKNTKELRGTVWEATSDSVINQQEYTDLSDLLKKIYTLFAEKGLVVTENQ